jgi:hypothetical protein
MSYQEALQVDPYWLPQVEQVLRNEGFGGAPQIWKSGQRSGWVKILAGGFQLHVRLFQNGVIQPEREVGWQYVEHLGTSQTAVQEISLILARYSIPYQIIYTECYTQNGQVPATRTPWLGVLAVAALGVALFSGLSGAK